MPQRRTGSLVVRIEAARLAKANPLEILSGVARGLTAGYLRASIKRGLTREAALEEAIH